MIVKVCGMREAENIRQVEQTGADWMGFIDYEGSPRYVADVPEYLPETVQKVGVFVNASLPRIRERRTAWQLNFVQLHGKESPEFCREVQQTGLRVIKAFSLRTPDDLLATESYAACCDYFLFDTPCNGYGGSGKSFDWEMLTHYHGETPFLLSGGLKPESLDALLKFSHSSWAGIDLNSGFEQAPGLKDAAALSDFIYSFKQNKYNL
ncbi:phosphoribosylanthranilate isomerase [Phocaeicola plebeius]|jgi:phosphoribosylanthranilate isomerase|uniref:phosphoribosylanthranilate isomerase n=1 Tax=Phocaeicola plebeius TaxID=310297 RepID=UPI000E5D4683|nr:phosphoribosylanthranilate isomerase [Phocaeicola plebeius]RGR56112.1 phosphoribosylanthranilate isomerase [Phocaeicola plebeius]